MQGMRTLHTVTGTLSIGLIRFNLDGNLEAQAGSTYGKGQAREMESIN